jgi:hypothetical protein
MLESVKTARSIEHRRCSMSFRCNISQRDHLFLAAAIGQEPRAHIYNIITEFQQISELQNQSMAAAARAANFGRNIVQNHSMAGNRIHFPKGVCALEADRNLCYLNPKQSGMNLAVISILNSKIGFRPFSFLRRQTIMIDKSPE